MDSEILGFRYALARRRLHPHKHVVAEADADGRSSNEIYSDFKNSTRSRFSRSVKFNPPRLL